jgi:choline-glycine betaine transporter
MKPAKTPVDWFATKVVLLWAASVAWAALLGMFVGRV